MARARYSHHDKDGLILSMRSALVNVIDLRLELAVLKEQLAEQKSNEPA
jgi:hypothetical protein